MKKSIKKLTMGIVVANFLTAFSVPSGPGTTKANGADGLKTSQNGIRPGKKISHDYDGLINTYAKQYNVSSDLVHAIVRYESGYNPNVVGGVGEIGLMQVRLETARQMGYTESKKELFNPVNNLRYGIKYLAGAHRLSGGDICGTVLKYNAGYGAKRMNPISARYCTAVKSYLKEA